MIEVNERLLLSFCLLSYNQERYIREAVAGALAQSYSPLEIILSDDCSSDRTFEIMKEMASTYRGPHKVILNRNARNSGVGAHINRIVELSSGPLVVLAAGDDVSKPERAQCLRDEWLRQNQLPTSIHSDYETIGGDGRQIADELKRHPFAGTRSAGLGDIRDYLRGSHLASNFLGATHAFSRVLFKEFGPLNTDVFLEDVVIGFRSLLHGSFAYVPRKLVLYRRHESNLSGRQANSQVSRYERVRQKIAYSAVKNHLWAAVLGNCRDDLDKFARHGGLTDAEGVALLREIERCLKIKACQHRVGVGAPLTSGCALLHLLVLGPRWIDGWSATKHWLFRTADHSRLLPKK